MLAPDFALVQGLFDLAAEGQDFVLLDGKDLVAAVVGADLASKAAENWNSWEKETFFPMKLLVHRRI